MFSKTLNRRSVSLQRRSAESARDEALAKVAELERVRDQLEESEKQVCLFRTFETFNFETMVRADAEEGRGVGARRGSGQGGGAGAPAAARQGRGRRRARFRSDADAGEIKFLQSKAFSCIILLNAHVRNHPRQNRRTRGASQLSSQPSGTRLKIRHKYSSYTR